MEGCGEGGVGSKGVSHPSTSVLAHRKPSEPSLGASVPFHWGLVGVSWTHDD